MSIDLNISRPPVTVAPPIGGDVPGAAKPPETRAAEPARATGLADLTRVAGEEPVDERALRRDDDLGKLIDRAFDLSAPPWTADDESQPTTHN